MLFRPFPKKLCIFGRVEAEIARSQEDCPIGLPCLAKDPLSPPAEASVRGEGVEGRWALLSRRSRLSLFSSALVSLRALSPSLSQYLCLCAFCLLPSLCLCIRLSLRLSLVCLSVCLGLSLSLCLCLSLTQIEPTYQIQSRTRITIPMVV
jgi:hypothetical protein